MGKPRKTRKTKNGRIALMSMYQKPKPYSDKEMKTKLEILKENKPLVKRLKKAHESAKKGKGRFV